PARSRNRRPRRAPGLEVPGAGLVARRRAAAAGNADGVVADVYAADANRMVKSWGDVTEVRQVDGELHNVCLDKIPWAGSFCSEEISTGHRTRALAMGPPVSAYSRSVRRPVGRARFGCGRVAGGAAICRYLQ